MSKYLDVQEVANMLGVTPATIYKLINHPEVSKRIEPVNRLTYRGDGGYRFSADSVELVKDQVIKKDLTIADTAKLLNRSKSFVHGLIQEGKLKSYEDIYRGKKRSLLKKRTWNSTTRMLKKSQRVFGKRYMTKRQVYFFFSRTSITVNWLG
ncbi:helix-turn-helix domain-containing protein [Paenibacillus farraposensis]|uniref:helix-turn-helix domain-containing protein n=1 Tax=Paenibacillus farraposensis TaxID=2807095 RepID=UPI0036118003